MKSLHAVWDINTNVTFVIAAKPFILGFCAHTYVFIARFLECFERLVTSSLNMAIGLLASLISSLLLQARVFLTIYWYFLIHDLTLFQMLYKLELISFYKLELSLRERCGGKM